MGTMSFENLLKSFVQGDDVTDRVIAQRNAALIGHNQNSDTSLVKAGDGLGDTGEMLKSDRELTYSPSGILRLTTPSRSRNTVAIPELATAVGDGPMAL